MLATHAHTLQEHRVEFSFLVDFLFFYGYTHMCCDSRCTGSVGLPAGNRILLYLGNRLSVLCMLMGYASDFIVRQGWEELLAMLKPHAQTAWAGFRDSNKIEFPTVVDVLIFACKSRRHRKVSTACRSRLLCCLIACSVVSSDDAMLTMPTSPLTRLLLPLNISRGMNNGRQRPSAAAVCHRQKI